MFYGDESGRIGSGFLVTFAPAFVKDIDNLFALFTGGVEQL